MLEVISISLCASAEWLLQKSITAVYQIWFPCSFHQYNHTPNVVFKSNTCSRALQGHPSTGPSGIILHLPRGFEPATFQSWSLPFKSPSSCVIPVSSLWGLMWSVAAGIRSLRRCSQINALNIRNRIPISEDPSISSPPTADDVVAVRAELYLRQCTKNNETTWFGSRHVQRGGSVYHKSHFSSSFII